MDKLIKKDEMQYSLFVQEDMEKQDILDNTIDNLKNKYGYDLIRKAGELNIEEIVDIKRK